MNIEVPPIYITSYYHRYLKLKLFYFHNSLIRNFFNKNISNNKIFLVKKRAETCKICQASRLTTSHHRTFHIHIFHSFLYKLKKLSIANNTPGHGWVRKVPLNNEWETWNYQMYGIKCQTAASILLFWIQSLHTAQVLSIQ